MVGTALFLAEKLFRSPIMGLIDSQTSFKPIDM